MPPAPHFGDPFIMRKRLETLAASLPQNRIVILCGQFGVAKLDDLNDEQVASGGRAPRKEKVTWESNSI